MFSKLPLPKQGGGTRPHDTYGHKGRELKQGRRPWRAFWWRKVLRNRFGETPWKATKRAPREGERETG